MEVRSYQHPLSVEDYLHYEADGRQRHEYIAGEVFAMTGASVEHNNIAVRLVTAFAAHVRGGPCRAHISDVKVRIKNNTDDIFYYPDVMVVCGQDGVQPYYVTNPILIVEVLSPATERVDRREKALHYKQLPSLEEYVLVAQEGCEITIQRRKESWQPVVITSPDATVELRSIGLSLPAREIYS
jgi:Uma2 family endonuclease